VERHYGRRLTRELVAKGNLTSAENQRKLQLLRQHYPLGFAAVWVSQLVPPKLLNLFSLGKLSGRDEANISGKRRVARVFP
jgi:hypothetical protein